MGEKLEAFYFAFGKHDTYIIADIPDHASVAAASLAVNASGAVAVRTTVLLTPEEMDQAAKKTVSYCPTGSVEKAGPLDASLQAMVTLSISTFSGS